MEQPANGDNDQHLFRHFAAGYGNFTFLFNMFHTSSFLRPYKDSEFPIDVNLRKQLYLQLEVKSNDSDLVMFIDSCKATPSIKPHAKPEYVFINGGYENRIIFL